MSRQCGGERQQGYALVELALALLIAALLAAWGTQALVNRLNDAQAHAAAVWMETVHKAVMAYVRLHGPEIQAATTTDALAGHGYQDWRRPSLAELAQTGLLASGLPQTTRLTGAARVNVWRRGECPGDLCIVEALVHGDRPVLRTATGAPDAAMMAQWLLATQGKGGAVHDSEPDRIRGAAFAFDSTLPDGVVLPPGTVGMAVTAEQQALWSFLRVGDRRDPDFQGEVSVAGTVRADADASVAGQLVVGAEVHDGDTCMPDKAVAHNVQGGLLVCQWGRWRSAGRAGGGYGYNSRYGCKTPEGSSTANPVTGGCSCPWYTAVLPIYDSGPQPTERGRQIAYLCVG